LSGAAIRPVPECTALRPRIGHAAYSISWASATPNAASRRIVLAPAHQAPDRPQNGHHPRRWARAAPVGEMGGNERRPAAACMHAAVRL
jgi:hypothetical protein